MDAYSTDKALGTGIETAKFSHLTYFGANFFSLNVSIPSFFIVSIIMDQRKQQNN